MSEPQALPPRPDLRHLRDAAKRLKQDQDLPTLALAQLSVARSYGFSSWPRLKVHVEAVTLDAEQRADGLVRSALSADTRRAKALLDADPTLTRHDLACACVAGDADEVARRLAADPDAATRPTGPFAHPPIVYASFSRLLRDPRCAPGIRQLVRLLLNAGADPNASFMHGDWLQVPLYGAAGIAGDAQLTKLLITAGADPNDAGEVHTLGEALYHACEFRDPACARLLIRAGTHPHVVEHCLGRAINFDHPEMVEMFCAEGAQPRARHLHQALWSRRPARTVVALLDAGAPLDDPDEHGLTPLQIAVRWGDGTNAAVLRDRGADESRVTPDDWELGVFLAGGGSAPEADAEMLTLLDEMVISAIRCGRTDAVVRLLDAGARLDGDPQAEDVPLGHACWRGRPEIAALLVARGATLQFPDGGSAIGAALHGSRHCNDPDGGPTMVARDEIPLAPYREIVRMLLAAGVPVPERVGESRVRPLTVIAELGLDPPA